MPQSQSWWDPTSPTDDNKPTFPDLEIKPMDKDQLIQEVDGEKLLTRRVHLLGLGSIGTLVAHALRNLPNPPPISLIMHRPEMYEQFKEGARLVRLVNNQTNVVDEQSGYDVDVIQAVGAEKPHWVFIPDNPENKDLDHEQVLAAGESLESGETFIYALIVTVKGPATVKALRSIKHRLDQRSTILFMQNGLGQIDSLNAEVFTDPTTRPTYMLGVISHGAYMKGPFNVVHTGFGTVALGIHRDTDKYPLPPNDPAFNASKLDEAQRKKHFPADADLYSSLSSRYLLRTLTRSTILACAPFPYLDLFQLQLEKLVSNCLINPLTALLDLHNGSMLGNPPLTHVQRLLLAEISLVLCGLPELQHVPNVRQRFASRRLEELFRGVTKKTAENSSSMREDVRYAKLTEIDFINGYIVKRGEQQGIKCVLNYMIMQLVKSKTWSQQRSGKGTLPYRNASMPADIEIKPITRMSTSASVTLDDVSSPTG